MAQDNTFVSDQKADDGEPEFMSMTMEDFERTGGDPTKLNKEEKKEDDDQQEKDTDTEDSGSGEEESESTEKGEESGDDDAGGTDGSDDDDDKDQGDESGSGDDKKPDESETKDNTDSEDAPARQVNVSDLSQEERNKFISELTGGAVKTTDELQNVLKNNEQAPVPFLSEDEQSMIAIARKSKELGISTAQALQINTYLKDMETPKSDKDLLLQSMVMEDLMNGQDPKQTREGFEEWYNNEYGPDADVDFMKQRNFASMVSSAKTQIQEMKSHFSDLKLDLPNNNNADSQEAKAKEQEGRNRFIESVEKTFNNPDFGELSFQIDKDESIKSSPENKADLKNKTANFLETLGKRWEDENGKVLPEKIAKDLYLLENAEKIIKKAASRATVKEREALEKGRRNISDNQPKEEKSSKKDATPKNWEDAMGDAEFEPARL